MRLVVIGGVAAGLSAASRARRLDSTLEIVVLEKGETISYAACGFPYYVEGRVGSFEQLRVYSPEYFATERRIEVRTQAEVAKIMHPRRDVTLTGGEGVAYDRLVIATGARPDLGGIAGHDQPHVFTLHCPGDAVRLREFVRTKHPRRAVVVGGGYIGIEVVEALRSNGLSVTLLAQDSRLLGRSNPTLVKAVTGQLRRFRVDYRPNTRVRSIEADRVVDVPCDLVVLAPGLKPNIEIAQEAGVEIGRTGAIRVTERMETNLTGVFAAGDCAEVTHLVTGRPSYVPLGTTANKMGRIAGANAAGARERHRGIAGTSIVRVLGLGVGMTGLSAPEARTEGFDAISVSIDSRDRPRYFDGRPTQVELVTERRTGKLLGGCVIGEEGVVGRVNVIATALHAGMDVEEFEQMDLAYAPPFAPVWDPVLIAAQQLRKMMD